MPPRSRSSLPSFPDLRRHRAVGLPKALTEAVIGYDVGNVGGWDMTEMGLAEQATDESSLLPKVLDRRGREDPMYIPPSVSLSSAHGT